MNKYSWFSFASLVIFICMFSIMLTRVSLGKFGSAWIFAMFLFPAIGAVCGVKAQNRVLKWLLIILNIIALCIIGYILLLAFSIGEK
ncbi:hypothetical protein BN1002_03691 [Bacillus sp. B-jedd]|nr:hypothetical protein BN1002_03691 [Bacillus sp. B-jedd]